MTAPGTRGQQQAAHSPSPRTTQRHQPPSGRTAMRAGTFVAPLITIPLVNGVGILGLRFRTAGPRDVSCANHALGVLFLKWSLTGTHAIMRCVGDPARGSMRGKVGTEGCSLAFPSRGFQHEPTRWVRLALLTAVVLSPAARFPAKFTRRLWPRCCRAPRTRSATSARLSSFRSC